MSRITAILVLSTATFLPGCIAIGGSESKKPPTVGQELIDLKTALDRGAITQQEFDQQKTILLSHPSYAQR